MRGWLYIFSAIAVSCIILSCNDDYPSDRETTQAGKLLFQKHCSSCHGFTSDGIGPSLSGVTKKVSREWLQKFIRNPKDVRDSVTVMPAFSFLTEDEITSIAAYLNIYKDGDKEILTPTDTVGDPVPEKIISSGITVNLVPVCTFPQTAKQDEKPQTRVTKLGFAPGSKALFVNELRGVLYRFEQDKLPTEFINIIRNFPRFISEPGLGTGFGSFAFHPDFVHNGLLFTTHTESAGSAKADFTFEDSLPHKLQWVVTEWKTLDAASDNFKGSHRELLRIDMIAESHGMQEIAFNPQAKNGDDNYGLLYLTVGDGGSVQLGYPFVAQGRDRIWGSVLRIDPAGRNSANKKYGIPETNPFYQDTSRKVVRELFAHGFRNPHRITWTPEGDLLVSNIGQANIESLYKVRAGDNCGWPVREGSFAFQPYGNLNHLHPLPANDSINHFTYPFLQYDHDEGKAISGGYVYNRNEIKAFQNKFIFGDIPTGRLFLADLKTKIIKEWNISVNGKATTLRQLCGNDRVDLHFGMDESGTIYILTKSDGKLYRITAN